MIQGFLRTDGRKGIRNITVVAYLVECAHHVARAIVTKANDPSVHLIGFPGCYPNSYALKIMKQLATHPNVGSVLLVSLGCEGFNRSELADVVRESGRPVETLIIQEAGGTTSTIKKGLEAVGRLTAVADECPKVDIDISELVVGTICGGSDGTSGISANPAVGRCFDKLIELGATCMFEETGELIGCEHIMKSRAVTPELGAEIVKSVEKGDKLLYYSRIRLFCSRQC